MKTCPFCAEEIQPEAVKCKHCQSDLSLNKSESQQEPEEEKKGWSKGKVIIGIVIFLIIVAAGGGCGSPSGSSTSSSGSNSSTGDDSSMSYVQAMNFVKSALKSPSSAKFPYYGEGQKTGTDTYKVDSYVDSQNGFGAMIRSDFSITLQLTGGDPADQRNWKVLKFTMDGQDLLNQ